MQPYRPGLPTSHLESESWSLLQLLSILLPPLPDVVAPSFLVQEPVVDHSLASSKLVKKFEQFDEDQLKLLLEWLVVLRMVELLKFYL